MTTNDRFNYGDHIVFIIYPSKVKKCFGCVLASAIGTVNEEYCCCIGSAKEVLDGPAWTGSSRKGLG